jgi:hypothetical protein
MYILKGKGMFHLTGKCNNIYFTLLKRLLAPFLFQLQIVSTSFFQNAKDISLVAKVFQIMKRLWGTQNYISDVLTLIIQTWICFMVKEATKYYGQILF